MRSGGANSRRSFRFSRQSRLDHRALVFVSGLGSEWQQSHGDRELVGGRRRMAAILYWATWSFGPPLKRSNAAPMRGLRVLLALGAHPAPADEAKQAEGHEQAGARLGDHRDAETDAAALIVRGVEVLVPRGEGARIKVVERSASDSAVRGGD